MSSQSPRKSLKQLARAVRVGIGCSHPAFEGPAFGSTPLTCQPFNLLPPPFHNTIFQGRDFPFIEDLSARLTFLLNPVSPIFKSSRIFTVRHKGLFVNGLNPGVIS